MDGERAHVLAEDLDELASTRPTEPCGCCPASTSTCSVPGPATATSYRGAPRRGEQAERLDLAGRGGGRRRVRHVGAGRRAGAGRVVRGGRQTAAHGLGPRSRGSRRSSVAVSERRWSSERCRAPSWASRFRGRETTTLRWKAVISSGRLGGIDPWGVGELPSATTSHLCRSRRLSREPLGTAEAV